MSAPPDIEGCSHRVVDVATADVGRLRVHLVEGGTGEPALLLHGWPQHFWCWREVAPRLAQRYRVICPDLRGFGWSDAPGRGYHPETFAADALALLDALGIERVRLIGHDWGGFSGFLLCLRHPERVQAFLALASPPPWSSFDPRNLLELRRAWYTWLLATPVLGEQVLRRPEFLGRMLRGSVPGLDRAAAEHYTRPLSEPARIRATTQLYRNYQRVALAVLVRRYDGLRLTVPTRLLLGARDPAIAPTLARGVERHADRIEVELLEGGGHFLPEEAPELVVERALALFES